MSSRGVGRRVGRAVARPVALLVTAFALGCLASVPPGHAADQVAQTPRSSEVVSVQARAHSGPTATGRAGALARVVLVPGTGPGLVHAGLGAQRRSWRVSTLVRVTLLFVVAVLFVPLFVLAVLVVLRLGMSFAMSRGPVWRGPGAVRRPARWVAAAPRAARSASRESVATQAPPSPEPAVPEPAVPEPAVPEPAVPEPAAPGTAAPGTAAPGTAAPGTAASPPGHSEAVAVAAAVAAAQRRAGAARAAARAVAAGAGGPDVPRHSPSTPAPTIPPESAAHGDAA